MADTGLKRPKEESGGPAPSNAPFHRAFFGSVFRERVMTVCQEHVEDTPVVILKLADDRELDLCHIEILAPQWMGVAVFRDSKSCEDMDFMFLPYEMITTVTVTRSKPEERRMGFQLTHPAKEAAARGAPCS